MSAYKPLILCILAGALAVPVPLPDAEAQVPSLNDLRRKAEDTVRKSGEDYLREKVPVPRGGGCTAAVPNRLPDVIKVRSGLMPGNAGGRTRV
jgi:hypothetical protein